jgi:hypothetical protein
MIEIAVAMICACLPSIRALLSRLVPILFGTALSRVTDSGGRLSRGAGTGTSGSTLRFVDYKGKRLDDSIVTRGGGLNWQDRSVLHVTTITTVKGSSSWLEDVTNTSPSPSDSGEARDTAQENAKRSDEIKFLHVGKQAIRIDELKRNHKVPKAAVSAAED